MQLYFGGSDVTEIELVNANGQKAYKTRLNVPSGPDPYDFEINFDSSIYQKAPNGGVMVLRVFSDTFTFERLIFLMP